MNMAFMAGLADGFKGFKQGQDDEDERQQKAKDRTRLAEDRAYQDEQRARTRAEQGRADTLRTDTEAAVKAVPQVEVQAVDPAQVDGGGELVPNSYKFGEQSNLNQAQAQGARLRAQGVALQGVLASRGDVKGALDLSNTQRAEEAGNFALSTAHKQDQRGDITFGQQQAEIAKKLAHEGLFDTARSMQGGNVDEFLKASGTGDWRPIKDSVKVTPVTTMVGGVPTKSFNWEFDSKGPDGEVKHVTKNSLQMQNELQPFEKLHAQAIAERNSDAKNLAAENGMWKTMLATGQRTGKADHFDEKQWDSAAKIDKSVVSFPGSDGSKDIESGDLRSTYMQTFNAARAGGAMAPNEAAEHATTMVVKLKNAAQARVEQARTSDKNATLTIDQAVKGILKEAASFKASQPAPAGGAKITLQQQQANDSDRGNILESELKAAQTRLAAGDPRAQADITALNRELGRSAPAQKVAAVAGTGQAQAPVAPTSVLAAQGAPTALRSLNTIDQIQADNIAAIAPIAQKYQQAEQQFIAVARSGDPVAISNYLKAKEGLRAQLEQTVTQKFGNAAPSVLQQLLSR